MRIIIFLLPFSLLLRINSMAQKNGAKETGMEGYALVWADECNKNGPPDITNWQFEKGFVRKQELQWYQPENAFCKNSYLIIEGRRASKANPLYAEGSNNWRKKFPRIQYTASSINTAGLHAWQYGRFIMRGRIDISKGLWPAW